MLTEKYDNNVRQKIEEMDEVPAGFSFNPSTNWKHLENKLQPVIQRKKFLWMYWAAASLVLLASLITIYSFNWQKPTIAKNTSYKKDIPSTSFENELNVIDKVTSMPKNQLQKSTNKNELDQATFIKAATKNQIIIIDSTKENEALILSPQNKTLLETPLSNSNLNSVQVEKPSIVVIKKARLKVIHINELDAPPPPIIAKAETRKQLLEQAENEAIDIEPSKPFWQKKQKPVNTSSLTDNQ